MKLRGEFAVRSVAGQVIAVPVGEWAVNFHGMVMLNDVSRVIWEALQEDTTPEGIAQRLTEHFEVDYSQALADTLEFLEQMRRADLLEEKA